MATDPDRVMALFQAAIDLSDPAERAAFLDREANCDADLRGRIDELLAPHHLPPADLEGSFGGAMPPQDDAEPGASTRAAIESDGQSPHPDRLIAGRYRLRQRLGEGGMGEVYLAKQVQPVRRRVALKLVRPGMDSRAVLARFDSERQALALMDHPNIARVLDAGSTDSGRPFFVMELVKGIPLTGYCDQHRLDIPARLDVFRQVCSAVQHAHQKGIIHRDLKPSNILVESHDGRPVPKVIDFGLAKATSGLRLSDGSVYTAFGSITGTPLYMAPEQAAFDALDIDTRADIYALGVILYELLTGSTPINTGTMKRAALDEMLRVIREDEPPTPSSRIGTSASLPSVAAARHVEPVRLSRLVRGDLDWIVMKALAKERDRRYESAIGLANDVARYLADEPVLAGPPTARYRTAKFIRRHRGRVVAAGLILLAFVGGMVGTTLGLIEAGRQRDRARVEAADLDQARVAEARSREVAERRSSQLGKVNEILSSIFRDLDLQQAEKEGRPAVAAIGERLDQASADLDGESIGDPLTVARLQATLGRAQVSLGSYPKAVKLLERSRAALAQLLGPDHPEVLDNLHYLARAEMGAGRLDRAIPLFEQVVKARQARLGPAHPDTLLSTDRLAHAYGEDNQPDRTVPLLERALEVRRAKLGPDHPNTLIAMGYLGSAYSAAGRLDRATEIHEHVLRSIREKLGPDHPFFAWYEDRLALDYQDAGRIDRAIPLHEQVLDRHQARLGPDHPWVLSSLAALARDYQLAGRPDRAKALFERTLASRRARLGSDHPDTLRSMTELAGASADAGEREQAIALDRECLEAYGRGEPGSLDAARAQVAAASRLIRWEKWAEAEAVLRPALATR